MHTPCGVTVLHVDRDGEFADRVKGALGQRHEGVEVVTAGTAGTALGALGSDIDCVVASYELPEMDGLDLLAAVREEYRFLPFVVLVTDEHSERVEQVLSADVTASLRRERVVGRAGTTTDGKEPAEGVDTEGVGALAACIEETLACARGREQQLQRYRQFVEHLPDTVAVLDEHLSVTYQSPNAPELRHEPPRIPDDGRLFEYIHPDDIDRVGAALERLLAEPDSIVTVECRAESAGGAWRWIEARAQNCLDTEPVDGILVSVRDVTERKADERELQRYSDTLETMQETTQQLLDATDPPEVADLAMESIETLLEFEVAGMWLADDSRERLEPVAVTERHADVIEEVPTYTADGESLSWEAYTTDTIRVVDGMHEQEGRHNPETDIRSELIVPLGEYGLLNVGTTEPEGFGDADRTLVELWAGTVTTVLERLDHERELREREAEIARERDRLESFAGVVSHDLRNPLHVAASRLELLDDDIDSEHLDAARRGLDRMETLIDDLLVLAREGRTVDDPDLVDLGAVVEDAWATARTDDATLVADVDQVIRADAGRLAQVFENLFRNAVEHGSTSADPETREDGVEQSSASAPSHAHEDASEDGPAVTVTVGDLPGGFYVADDGPGIPESERERVFESGHSTSAGGSGLGLAIAREIVTAHGWEIEVTESESGGARFEITGVETR